MQHRFAGLRKPGILPLKFFYPGQEECFLSLSIPRLRNEIRIQHDVASAEFNGIVVHKQMRRANVQRIPYGVFYLVEPQQIIVVAVLHGRRAPRQWKSRLQ